MLLRQLPRPARSAARSFVYFTGRSAARRKEKIVIASKWEQALKPLLGCLVIFFSRAVVVWREVNDSKLEFGWLLNVETI